MPGRAMANELVSPSSGEALIDSAATPRGHPAGRSGRGLDHPTGAPPAWLQVAPFAAVFVVFFLVPLALTVMVSFWDYTEYEIVPAFTLRSYLEMFEGCLDRLPGLCVTFKTYLSTLEFCLIVWLVTLVVGFFVAYFLSFHVRSTTMQIALFLVCTIPFWTSNIIR